MTITLTREEAQQVLDALEAEHSAIYGTSQTVKAIETLRTRLAQPEPDFDWKDMYEKEKRRREMWTAKYEKDIRKLERAVPTAQPEPEPVADKYLMEVECTKCGAKQDGILTVNAPPQREWQGLTDEEIRNEAKNHVFDESFFSGAIWARGQIMRKNNG